MKRFAAVLLSVALAATIPARGIDGLQVGMQAPGFSLSSLEGRSVSLGDFKESKLVVLIFFATWNERSGELLERMERVYEERKDEGLSIIGINVESLRISPEEEAAVGRMIREQSLTFPVLVDRGLEAFRAYGVVAVPSTVLVGDEGTIVGELSGYPLAMRESFFDLIEATLTGKPRPPASAKTAPLPNPRAVRYFNLARALAARGSVDMADADLRKSIEIDPAFVLPKILLGQLLKERALTDERVAFQGKTYTTAFFSTEEKKRDLTDAGALFRQALEVEPGNAVAMTELGSLRAVQGGVDEAQKLFRQALAADPSYTPAHSGLGALLLRKGNLREGHDELEAATRLNPLDFRIYLTFARAYEERGMDGEALDLYRKSLELLWSSRKELFPFSFGR